MTDFRALCQELMDAIDSGIPVERIKQSPLAVRVDAALAQPEPQGPPKNCWLDDEPYLCPSPCVFDDPSEVIDNCVEARYLSEKGKPKEACKYYRTTAQPEPQGPTDAELNNLANKAWISVDVLKEYDLIENAFDCCGFARAVLARWGRPAIEPVPQGPSETAWALAQLLDGVQRHDLPNMTGLSDSDCDRIWAARPATTGEQQ